MFKWIRELIEALHRGRRFVTHDVWHIGRPGDPVPEGFIIKHIRVAVLLVQNIIQDALLLRASALTFATALSIVPFLLFAFALIQWLNLDHEMYSYLAGQVMEGEENGEDLNDAFIREQVRDFLLMGPEDPGLNGEGGELGQTFDALLTFAEERADPRTIGLGGFAFILATLFGLMMNIEKSFNKIWGLKQTRSRYRMFTDYFVLLVLLVVVIVGVLSLFAVLESEAIRDRLGPFAFALRGVQFGVICLAFTAMYYFVPNTRVVLRYAFIAGVLAGLLWLLVSLGYVKFQFGMARYSLIYTSYFTVPLLLMWMYASWVVVLAGAELTFAYQNEKTFAMERYAAGTSQAYREALGLRAMLDICHRFENGLPPLATLEAAQSWNVPSRLLNETLDQLQEAGLVTRCAPESDWAHEPPRYQPGRSVARITVGDVIRVLRETGRDPSDLRHDERFKPLLERIHGGSSGIMEVTLGELIRQQEYTPLALEGPDGGEGADAAKPAIS